MLYSRHSKSVHHDRISVFHLFLYLFSMFLTNLMYKHRYLRLDVYITIYLQLVRYGGIYHDCHNFDWRRVMSIISTSFSYIWWYPWRFSVWFMCDYGHHDFKLLCYLLQLKHPHMKPYHYPVCTYMRLHCLCIYCRHKYSWNTDHFTLKRSINKPLSLSLMIQLMSSN